MRAQQLGSDDPWLKPTLILAAFQAGDAALADQLVKEIRREGRATWKIEAVLHDIDRYLAYFADQPALARVRDKLQLLLS